LCLGDGIAIVIVPAHHAAAALAGCAALAGSKANLSLQSEIALWLYFVIYSTEST
jgi:hypothetical protein